MGVHPGAPGAIARALLAVPVTIPLLNRHALARVTPPVYCERAIMSLQTLLGIDIPIVQAPMAGVQGSALAVAVSNAGGLGSLPCALLGLDTIRKELTAMQAQTSKPYNLNFFCHTPPEPNEEQEKRWRAALAPYYAAYQIDA